MFLDSFPICVLLCVLCPLWQLRRVSHDVRDELAEALGVLRGNDRLAGLSFQHLTGNTCHIAAPAGDLLVLVKALRQSLVRNRPVSSSQSCMDMNCSSSAISSAAVLSVTA